jgi:outer membrane protein TolC
VALPRKTRLRTRTGRKKQVESDVAAAQASAADIANVQLEIHAELASDYLQACGLDEEERLYQQTIANDNARSI